VASANLAIHVLPDSNPENVSGLLNWFKLNNQRHFQTSKALVDTLIDTGVNANDWVTSTSVSLGLLEKREDGFGISSSGLTVSKMQDEVKSDLFHFLLYTGWKETAPRDFLQSWAYRLCCDQYWNMGDVSLSSDYLNQQVADIISLAYHVFPKLGVEDFEDISFSRKSITGVHKWLDALDPPVMVKGNFQRRTFCHPELSALAIGYAFRDDPQIANIDVLLTPDKQDIINKVCLLDPNSLDRVLDWTISVYPTLFEKGTKSGFYGRFLRIKRLPTIEDVIR
jgi:hypothetical protein